MSVSLKSKLLLAFILAVSPVILLSVSVLYRNTANVSELQQQVESAHTLLLELHACNSKVQASFHRRKSNIDLSGCEQLIKSVSTIDAYREQLVILNMTELLDLHESASLQRYINPLRQLVDYLTPLAALDMKTRSVALLEATRLLHKILGVQVLIAALMALVLGLILSKQILTPLQRLIEGIQAVSAGAWGQQVLVKSADELGQVGNAFNRLSLELRETAISREQLHRIVDTIHEGLLLIDCDGKIKQANQSFLKLCGYSSEQLGELMLNEILLNYSVQSLECEQAIASRELELQHRSGEKIPVSVLAARLAASELEPSEFIISVRDERVRIALRNEREHLERRINHSERLAALGTLSAEVAHRLNQPLSSIRLFLQQMRRNISAASTRECLQKDLELCLAEVGRASDAVKSILNYTRKASNDRAQKIQLAAVLQKVFDVCRDIARSVNMQLELRVSGDLVVPGNEAELTELFFVLTRNALDAASLQASSSLRVLAKTSDRQAVVTFEDTAGGIKPEILTTLFEPFVTGKEHGQGTGLGLSIARKIVEDHNGSISVSSEAGRGCRFEIKLPLEAVTSSGKSEVLHV